MLGPFVFLPILLATILYAFWRGGRDERVVAAICLVGTVASLASMSPLITRYDDMDTGLALVDLAVLAGFIVVALQSNRFWPLWIAGFQLTTIFGHGLKLLDGNLLPRAYGASLQFWVYPILLVLVVGTWRAHRRSRQVVTI